MRKQILHSSLFTLHFFLLPLQSLRSPRWWNGRHEGLKIPWLLQLCGFESRSRHVNLDQAFFDLMLFENISTEIVLFFILYGITGVVPFIAAVYLLFRRANAIMPGVTPPVRLRCWTISFFALITLAHVWWLLFYICYGDMSSDIYASDMSSKIYLVCVMLDSVLLFTTLAGTLLAMLQDRYRPVWPVLVAILPFVVFGSVFMVYPSELIEQLTNVYLLLLCLLFSVYMVFAIRQYGRWLNDNYADLENKKVWLIQVVSLVCMLMFVLYTLATNLVLIFSIHFVELVLVGLLLWRVETLPQLDCISTEETHTAPVLETAQVEECCVGGQLYLQHDLSVIQLAQAIGINRFYLSQYFSRHGQTYNAYINDLRINHFMNLYREAVKNGQPVSAQQLASDSGYHSYSTFSLAFKKRTGQSVTAWMHEMAQ